jgi:DNA repair protein RadA
LRDSPHTDSRNAAEVSKARGLVFGDVVRPYNKAACRPKSDEGTLSRPIKTAAEILESKKISQEWISTGSKTLDSIFGGNGIETASVTEFHGAACTGKTQICYTLSVMVNQQELNEGIDRKVIYIDTENKFKPDRISSIAKERGLEPSRVLKNILLMSPRNSLEQESTLDFVDNLGEIVDSVIFHYRAEYSGRSSLSERQQRLYRFMHKLSTMAVTHKMAVIVTNHVQSNPDSLLSPHPNPLGGHVMAHTSTYRIYLRQSGYNILAKIIGSPCHAKMEVLFRIGDKGVESRDEPSV